MYSWRLIWDHGRRPYPIGIQGIYQIVCVFDNYFFWRGLLWVFWLCLFLLVWLAAELRRWRIALATPWRQYRHIKPCLGWSYVRNDSNSTLDHFNSTFASTSLPRWWRRKNSTASLIRLLCWSFRRMERINRFTLDHVASSGTEHLCHSTLVLSCAATHTRASEGH